MVIVFAVYLMAVRLSSMDAELDRTEYGIRGGMLQLSIIFDMDSMEHQGTDELAEYAGKKDIYIHPMADPTNPFPFYLPRYLYSIVSRRPAGKAPVFMRAKFDYWLRQDREVIFYWDGRIETVRQ